MNGWVSGWMNAFLSLPPVSPFITGMRARWLPVSSLLFSFFASFACNFWHSLSKNNFVMDSLLQTHQDKITGSREEPCNSNTKVCPHSLHLPHVRGHGRKGKRQTGAINWTCLNKNDMCQKCATSTRELNLISILWCSWYFICWLLCEEAASTLSTEKLLFTSFLNRHLDIF